MTKAIPVQSIELAVSAPKVMSHRLFQLSSAGLTPSHANYQELSLMWAEKVLGFGESLMATTLETVHFQQQVLASTSGYWTMPWLLPQAMVTSSVLHTPAASERMLRKAMAPIHEKVVANANRLSEK